MIMIRGMALVMGVVVVGFLWAWVPVGVVIGVGMVAAVAVGTGGRVRR